MLTTHELQERLCKLDEVTLMELLDISSEDLVERFVDYIEAKKETLTEETEWLYANKNLEL